MRAKHRSLLGGVLFVFSFNGWALVMQSVHATRFMIRTLRGTYVRTNSEDGIGYVMFRTKTKAKEWADNYATEDCFVVKVRAAITPTVSGRTERLVAIREARPKTLSEKIKNNFFPY
jgi:7-keto-8-aminopelargonate synthetase-like enzyme